MHVGQIGCAQFPTPIKHAYMSFTGKKNVPLTSFNLTSSSLPMQPLKQLRSESSSLFHCQSLTWELKSIMRGPQVMQPDEAITLAIKLAAVEAEEASWNADVASCHLAGPTPSHHVSSGGAPNHQPIQLVRSQPPMQLQHPARLQQAARDQQLPVLDQWMGNFIR